MWENKEISVSEVEMGEKAAKGVIWRTQIEVLVEEFKANIKGKMT